MLRALTGTDPEAHHMDKLVIQGGAPLSGTVPVSGAKNAALPILIATLLAPGVHEIRNVPDLVDVGSTLSLLGRMGLASLVQPPAEGELGLAVRLDASRVAFNEAPYDLVRKMRASVLALGPLLARCGEAHVSLPGGCAIGVRPIDQHLKGLEALGCEFQLEGGYVHGTVKALRGAEVVLDMPTVTGTENILMAAVLARGRSVIRTRHASRRSRHSRASCAAWVRRSRGGERGDRSRGRRRASARDRRSRSSPTGSRPRRT
jgi:UDP-N-acetylglucosamine 1-carboxyvinyltransferase